MILKLANYSSFTENVTGGKTSICIKKNHELEKSKSIDISILKTSEKMAIRFILSNIKANRNS